MVLENYKDESDTEDSSANVKHEDNVPSEEDMAKLSWRSIVSEKGEVFLSA